MGEQIEKNVGQHDQKTFTQEEVTRMMTAEKEQGRRSVLKEFGIEDIASAKESLQKYQEFLNSQKTQLEQAQAEQAKLQSDYADAMAKATHAENCMAAMKQGANAEFIDDLVVLARSRVTEGKSFEDVLTEMKGNPAYSGFFKAAAGTGQGSMQGKPIGQGEGESLAKSLAEKSTAYRKQQSNYFRMS